MFAKIAILNKMVTKNQFFKAFREHNKCKGKQNFGAIMESEGFLSNEEVGRIMQSISLIFATKDDELRGKREDEINLALAAQRDGLVSPEDMAGVLEELQEKAGDPEHNIEGILVKRELLTEEEIERLKAGKSVETLSPGLSLDAFTMTEFADKAEPEEMEIDEEAPIELTLVKLGHRLKRPPVQKWRVAVNAFQEAQKILKAESKRIEEQIGITLNVIADIKNISEYMKRMQDNLRAKKMMGVKTEIFQDWLKEAKRLEKIILKVMRKTRDRGKLSGAAVEKVQKSLHQGFTALKRR